VDLVELVKLVERVPTAESLNPLEQAPLVES
jgi:hypothetical protein